MTVTNLVPDSDDFVQQEPTPITDIAKAFEKIAETSQLVRILVKTELPAIKTELTYVREAANEASTQALLTRARQEDFSRRLDTIDNTLTTTNVSVLKRDLETVCDEATTLKKEVRSGGARRAVGILLGAFGSIFAVIGVAWSLSGSLATVTAAVGTERVLRETQFNTVQTQLETMPTKADLELVKQAVEKNGHDSIYTLCEKLSPTQRNVLRQQVKQGKLPPHFACP